MADQPDAVERAGLAAFITLTVIVDMIWVIAVAALLAGDADAINGVIGAGLFAAPLTVALVVGVRTARRNRKPEADLPTFKNRIDKEEPRRG